VFEENDKAMMRGLIRLLNDGTFELKGSAVPGFVMIYNWVRELDSRIKKDLEPKEEKKEEK